jgi:hypothetical protein
MIGEILERPTALKAQLSEAGSECSELGLNGIINDAHVPRSQTRCLIGNIIKHIVCPIRSITETVSTALRIGPLTATEKRASVSFTRIWTPGAFIDRSSARYG